MSFTVRQVREEKKSSATLRKYTLIGITLLESLVHLWHRVNKRHEEEVKEERRAKILKRIIMVLLSGLLILLLLIGALKILVRLKTITLGSMVSMVSADPARDKHGFTNVLLLGEGNSDHDGVDLTDTLMVVSLDPASKSAVMLSLPRDLYALSTEKMGKGRINSLYRDYKLSLIRHGTEKSKTSGEALQQLAEELGTVIGLQIHGVIKLNFSGFTEGIDLLGGVDIDVPEEIVDPEYPGPNYSFETFTLSGGRQHLDGATALKYARSRHSTSDFSRSSRQQQIIAAATEKAKQGKLLTNAGRASEIMSILAKNMETTFRSRELLGLLKIGKAIDRQRIFSMQLNDQNGLFGGLTGPGGFLYAPPREQFEGASVLLPVSIPEFPITWKQIRTLLKLLTTEREAFLQPPTLVIANAGAKEGSARLLGAELTRYGFNVLKTRNFSKPNQTFEKSWIALHPLLQPDRSKHVQYSSQLMMKIFSLSLQEHPDALSFETEQPDLLIVLGEDYRYTPLQDLIR